MPGAQREGKLLLAAPTVGSGRESFMALASYFWDDYGKGGVILWHRVSTGQFTIFPTVLPGSR